jgi:hypothetical protein
MPVSYVPDKSGLPDAVLLISAVADTEAVSKTIVQVSKTVKRDSVDMNFPELK